MPAFARPRWTLAAARGDATFMRPARIAAELVHRIEAELKVSEAWVSPWPDRFLLSAICSGALAACVIIAALVGGAASPAPTTGRTALANSTPPLQSGAPLALA